MSTMLIPQLGVSGSPTVTGSDSVQASTLLLRDTNGDAFANIFRAALGVRSAGHLYLGFVAKSANFTVDESTNNGTFYLCDSTSGTITVTLPAAATVMGKVLIFKKTAAGNSLVLDPNGSETVDGSTTKTATAIYAVMAVISDGTNWQVLHSLLTWS